MCLLIASLVFLIAICVYALYHDLGPDASLVMSSSQEEPTVTVFEDTLQTATSQESRSAEKPVTRSAEKPVTKPAEKPVTRPATVEIPKGPFTVKNCATGKNNLLRQNPDNSLSLIDEKGKQLWKVPFPGKLCGMVGQVDFFNNGKIQFLVVEGTRLHLIDRLGREVKSFPRNLPAKAVIGPDKVEVSGKNYWRIDTENGPIYADLKANKFLTEI